MVDIVSEYIVVHSLLDCCFPRLQLCQRQIPTLLAGTLKE